MAITGGTATDANNASTTSTPGNSNQERSASDAGAAAAAANNININNNSRQIPIVCPGHTRPLAELQFCHVLPGEENSKTLLVSACHGAYYIVLLVVEGSLS